MKCFLKNSLLTMILLLGSMNLYSSTVHASTLTPEVQALRRQFDSKLKEVCAKILKTAASKEYAELEKIAKSLIGKEMLQKLKEQITDNLPPEFGPKESRIKEAVKILRLYTPKSIFSENSNTGNSIGHLFRRIQKIKSGSLPGFFIMLNTSNRDIQAIIENTQRKSLSKNTLNQLNKLISNIARKASETLKDYARSPFKKPPLNQVQPDENLNKLVQRSGVTKKINFFDGTRFNAGHNYIVLPINKYRQHPQKYNGILLGLLRSIYYDTLEHHKRFSSAVANIFDVIPQLKVSTNTRLGLLACTTALPPFFCRMYQHRIHRSILTDAKMSELENLSLYLKKVLFNGHYQNMPADCKEFFFQDTQRYIKGEPISSHPDTLKRYFINNLTVPKHTPEEFAICHINTRIRELNQVAATKNRRVKEKSAARTISRFAQTAIQFIRDRKAKDVKQLNGFKFRKKCTNKTVHLALGALLSTACTAILSLLSLSVQASTNS